MTPVATVKLIETGADIQIISCIDEKRNFSVIAGAGSGKTTSLVSALSYIRAKDGPSLRRDARQVACITFTNRARDVISERLGWDDLYLVATLHSFLWAEIKRFVPDIRKCLIEVIIPSHIEKQREKDKGGNSKAAIAAREKAAALEVDLELVADVTIFKYDDTSTFSNYPEGRLSHDDVIALAGALISGNETLQRIIGQKYPYIFVDEAQDTFNEILTAINDICANEGLPIVGYFGDPMQQIYDRRAGDFHGPEGSLVIPKEENFRCSPPVIRLLNAFRTDVEQIPAGKNAETDGSVELYLVAAEAPEGPRKTYTEEQLERTAQRFEELLDSWGWREQEGLKLLFLVRQMIARRLGFIGLHRLFTGKYASTRAQEDYESGEYMLLKPFTRSIWSLVSNFREGNKKEVIDILRAYSPAFDPEGENSARSIREMLQLAEALVRELSGIWDASNLGEILRFVRDRQLYPFPERLMEELEREPMEEEYNEEFHSQDKGRWLADEFFQMDTYELATYIDFLNDKTPFSTQHGVKGEEYLNVCTVFDDTEAGWNNYSFTKMLTPATAGEGTEGQMERSRKLAYVCFSRAVEHLKIVLFTPNPDASKAELIQAELFTEEQISIVA